LDDFGAIFRQSKTTSYSLFSGSFSKAQKIANGATNYGNQINYHPTAKPSNGII
jgi:hypothetical protein